MSVLQHPAGARAPAPKMAPSQDSTGRVDYVRDPPEHPLGLVPHQIRGFASTFQHMLISGQSYDCCSACSPKIVNEYRRSGWEFIKRALTESNYVSELSGLADLQRSVDATAVDWDSEEGLSDEGEGELIDA